MNQDKGEGVSRRDAVQRAIGAIAGVAMVSLTGAEAWAAETKLAKSAVKYVDASKDEGKDCDDCSQFIPGKTDKDLGTCRLVEGAINPHGHCIAFTPKPKK